MKRMQFRRPTDHYDERIKQIDQKICELIKERKEVSDNNPGYPPFEYISGWAEKFDLYEDLLKSIFSSLWNDKIYKPLIEPEGFQKNLTILKSVQSGSRLFSVTCIHQYSNSSVVSLNIDLDNSCDLSGQTKHTNLELSIDSKHDCRLMNGAGGDGYFHYNFVVSPSLPDDVSGIKLKFKELGLHFTDTKAESDIVIQL